MSVKAIYTCDICGRQKGETNHWYAVETTTRQTIHPTITVKAFDDGGGHSQHICGSTCLLKRIAEFENELKASIQQVEWSREADENVSVEA